MESPRELLERWRSEHGYTKARAAELLGCDPTYVGALESGKRFPGRRIANVLEEIAGIPSKAWDELEAVESAVSATSNVVPPDAAE